MGDTARDDGTKKLFLFWFKGNFLFLFKNKVTQCNRKYMAFGLGYRNQKHKFCGYSQFVGNIIVSCKVQCDESHIASDAI